MTVVVELEQDHWIQAVKADGRKVIDDVLAGSAPLGRLSAAEPEDAIATLMRGSDTATVDAFDRACLEALSDFRTSILSLKGPAFDVALSRLASLLAIVRRMKPSETVVDLHKNYVIWNAFFENFVIDRGLDLRREFLRILTLTQQEAEDIGLAPRRLMPLWLAICGESGGSGQYDESYLKGRPARPSPASAWQRLQLERRLRLARAGALGRVPQSQEEKFPPGMACPRRRFSTQRGLLAAACGSGDRCNGAGAF
jgi:hypothetical protein